MVPKPARKATQLRNKVRDLNILTLDGLGSGFPDGGRLFGARPLGLDISRIRVVWQ